MDVIVKGQPTPECTAMIIAESLMEKVNNSEISHWLFNEKVQELAKAFYGNSIAKLMASPAGAVLQGPMAPLNAAEQAALMQIEKKKDKKPKKWQQPGDNQDNIDDSGDGAIDQDFGKKVSLVMKSHGLNFDQAATAVLREKRLID